jgi:hypothetical protein
LLRGERGEGGEEALEVEEEEEVELVMEGAEEEVGVRPLACRTACLAAATWACVVRTSC